MRRCLQAAFVGTCAPLVLLLAGCAGLSPGSGSGSAAASPAAAACVDAGAAHKAYVVVEHGGGTTVQKCVGFNGDKIGGEDLMKKSGLEYQTQDFSGVGKAVCQVDNEPAQFSECFPKDKPFWAMYVSQGGGQWQPGQTAYTAVSLKDGGALGWEYQSATASPPPPPMPKK